MAIKTKTRYVDLSIKDGNFVSRFLTKSQERTQFNQTDIELLRHILTPEKAKLLHAVKYQKPTSIYHLSKLLKRDFKSVWTDLKLLERFGFIEFQKKRQGKRTSLIPSLTMERMEIVIEI